MNNNLKWNIFDYCQSKFIYKQPINDKHFKVQKNSKQIINYSSE
jgi:hypothetical protein